jgi:hypothetical protein
LVATITVQATSPGTLTNTAVCGAAVTDLAKANNTVDVKTVATFPQVNFAQSGNNLVISWPIEATGYTLEFTTNLATPVFWTSVGLPAPSSVGGMRYVTNSIGAGNRFFRLRTTGP